MNSGLKRDQIPPKQAINWRSNFLEERNLTFNLIVPTLVLLKETYKILTGDNENRVRIYLGLEQEKKEDQFVLGAFAVSAFLLGSGDVYADYETPVFKLGEANENYSHKTGEVIDSIKRFRIWRTGELDSENKWAEFRQYIYPNAYLLTKYELHEIFNVQNSSEAQIGFGISKSMSVIIFPGKNEVRDLDDPTPVFDFTGFCPPYCDERSIYNPA